MDLAKDLEPEVPQEEIAAAEEKPQEEQKLEVEVEAKEEKPEQVKTVPHAALHEERERRKATQRELEQYRQQTAAQMAVLNDRLQQIYQTQNPGPQFRDPNSDPDPLAAMTHNQNLTLQELNALKAERQQQFAAQQQASQVAEYENQLVTWGSSAAAEFKAENPDWDAAYKHIYQVRAKERMAMGYKGQALDRIMRQDELSALHEARVNGVHPAEMMYNLAVAAGYTKKGPNPAEKIEQIQKGQGAAKTLGNGGPAGMPTPEQIAAMNEDDFAEFKAKLSKQGKRISDVL